MTSEYAINRYVDICHDINFVTIDVDKCYDDYFYPVMSANIPPALFQEKPD